MNTVTIDGINMKHPLNIDFQEKVNAILTLAKEKDISIRYIHDNYLIEMLILSGTYTWAFNYNEKNELTASWLDGILRPIYQVSRTYKPGEDDWDNDLEWGESHPMNEQTLHRMFEEIENRINELEN